MLKRPTIEDVAKRAHLSVSTVSLVMNKIGRVSDETRHRVLQVVDELGYYPIRSARGLASRTSGNIGFILSDDHFSQAEPFYTKILLGAEFEARRHDYYILMTTVPRVFKHKSHTPRFLLERNVDGVIVAGQMNTTLVDYIGKSGIPIVLVDYQLKNRRFSSVLIDNRAGASTAVNHLLRGGRRNIAFVAGDLAHPSMTERFLAFLECLEDNGVPAIEKLIVTDEPDTGVQDGYRAMKKIFERGGEPSAVFAANDAMAFGCMQHLKSRGIKIPEGTAVMGFDDIELCLHVEPRLTTIRVPKEEMGKLAVQRIVEEVKSKARTIVTVHVPVELVVRESTGIAAAGNREVNDISVPHSVAS